LRDSPKYSKDPGAMSLRLFAPPVDQETTFGALVNSLKALLKLLFAVLADGSDISPHI